MKRKGAAKSGSRNRRGFSAGERDEDSVGDGGGGTGDSADTGDSASEVEGSVEEEEEGSVEGFFCFVRCKVETASGSTEIRSPG